MRRTPWTPIFDPDAKRGAIRPGGTVAFTVVPVSYFTLDEAGGEQLIRLVTQGNYLYSCRRLGGFDVVDITGGGLSVVAGVDTSSYPVTASAIDVDSTGVYAFVGGDGEFAVVDTTTKASPSPSTMLTGLGADATDLAYYEAGDVCWLANGSGIQVIDTSTKSTPSLSSTSAGLNTGGDARLLFNGVNLFIMETGRLESVDTSLVSQDSVSDSRILAVQFALNGGYIYALGEGGSGEALLMVIDVSDPTSMFIETTVTIGTLGDDFSPEDFSAVAKSGNTIGLIWNATSSAYSQLTYFGASNPALPVVSTTTDISASVAAGAADGSLVAGTWYVADWFSES